MVVVVDELIAVVGTREEEEAAEEDVLLELEAKVVVTTGELDAALLLLVPVDPTLDEDCVEYVDELLEAGEDEVEDEEVEVALVADALVAADDDEDEADEEVEDADPLVAELDSATEVEEEGNTDEEDDPLDAELRSEVVVIAVVDESDTVAFSDPVAAAASASQYHEFRVGVAVAVAVTVVAFVLSGSPASPTSCSAKTAAMSAYIASQARSQRNACQQRVNGYADCRGTMADQVRDV